MSTEQNGPEVQTQTTATTDAVSAMATQAATMSWDDFNSIGDEPSDGGIAPPRILSIGKDAAYIGICTKAGVQIATHYLEETDNFASGYVHCLGDDCPACRSGMKQNQFLLMPVYDHLTGEIALLRVSTVKGAGKLATELGKVMSLAEPDKVIAKITRDNRFSFSVDVLPNDQHDPDAIRKVQDFKARLDGGTVDLTSSVTMMTGDEMIEHPRIAKTLQLEGMA